MSHDDLRQEILSLAEQPSPSRAVALPLLEQLLSALESGQVRAAQPVADGWKVHSWVKHGILLGFRIGMNRAFDQPPA